MPKLLTQYRVFIGSPGGLVEERECFRRKLERYTAVHCEPRGVVFHPVGWEDTLGSVGRPQKLINEDLRQCDYAVFVLHDRWGSPPGSSYTSGTEEEWSLAEELYKANKIRNIALFFKQVAPGQIRDPGPQLGMVLAFKERIEAEKRYLFRQYETTDQFAEALEGYLAKWQRDNEAREFVGGEVVKRGTPSTLSVGGAAVTLMPPRRPRRFRRALSIGLQRRLSSRTLTYRIMVVPCFAPKKRPERQRPILNGHTAKMSAE